MIASTRRSSGAQGGRWLLIALALAAAFALILAACGTGASPGDQEGAAPVLPASSAAGDEFGRDGDEGGQGGSDVPPYADLAERQIVKTGEVTVEVASVAAAVGEVRAMALQMNGYVGGSSAGDPDDPATLTLRIPASRFDAAITALHQMDGEVVAETTREQDVTGSVVDLEARIRNLQASEAQYRALLGRATEIEDILTVQLRLDEVRGEIEQLQAQLDQLSGQASLATLTVTLVPVVAPVEEQTSAWDAGQIFDSAVAALVGLGQAVATVGIWLGIVGLPLALLAGIVLLVVLRAAPAFRRRPVNPADQT